MGTTEGVHAREYALGKLHNCSSFLDKVVMYMQYIMAVVIIICRLS
jgi:hypothetical protein